MKKYLLLMIVVLTTSCRTYYSEQSNVLDFRKYTENGFVINPTSSGMDFEPISMISVSFYSGEKLKGVFKNENGIIPIGETIVIARKDITDRSVVYSATRLNKKGYKFKTSVAGRIDSIAVTRLK